MIVARVLAPSLDLIHSKEGGDRDEKATQSYRIPNIGKFVAPKHTK